MVSKVIAGLIPLVVWPADVRLDGDYVDVRGDGGAGAYAEVTPEEEALLRRFMPDSTTERRTLADIIMEKLKEAERGGGSASDAAGGAAGGAPGGDGGGGGLDPKIVEVYTEVRVQRLAWLCLHSHCVRPAQVGRFLSHYKSGALPKVFKVIPALAEWEDVLFLTNPETVRGVLRKASLTFSSPPGSGAVDPARDVRRDAHLCVQLQPCQGAALLQPRPAPQGTRRRARARPHELPPLCVCERRGALSVCERRGGDAMAPPLIIRPPRI